MKKALSILLVCFMLFALAGCGSSGSGGTKEPVNSVSVDAATPAPNETETQDTDEPELEEIKNELEFGNGEYTVGVDFPAGTYDVLWVSGWGNVYTDKFPGVNAIFGPADSGNETLASICVQSAENVKFTEGTVLTISTVMATKDMGSLTIKLVKK